ncbi:MAG TPA: SUMF1/EgtB/PvdO family nonheme iron enzyme [Cyclobacteriaceae bacterium]|nr:SUMF1/EgtB/PvdO family nonheme iron enzyme [Cyclobacteriaceae bacterium]
MIIFILLSTVCSLSAQDLKTYDQKIGSTSFKMIAVPGGKFQIGSPPNEPGRDADEGPQKTVEISPFWMQAHEVTFGEWDVFFKDMDIPQAKNIDGITRPTPQYIDLTWGMGRESNKPTNSMSQQAAVMFCKWLYSKTGFFYRLPTEAEWEYACKTGNGNANVALADAAYSVENSGGKFHEVQKLKPNKLGIYDLLGNLSEWTSDQYDQGYYSNIAAKDPSTIPGPRYPRTTKGGSYLDDAKQLRCSNRIPSDAKWNVRDPQIPKSRWWLTDGMFVGFRVVRPQTQPTAAEIDRYYSAYLK